MAGDDSIGPESLPQDQGRAGLHIFSSRENQRSGDREVISCFADRSEVPDTRKPFLDSDGECIRYACCRIRRTEGGFAFPAGLADVVLINIKARSLREPVIRSDVQELLAALSGKAVFILADNDNTIEAIEAIELGVRGYFPMTLSVAS